MRPVLGLVTIGQTPRPDLEAEFRRHAPDADVRTVGALDGLTNDEIASLRAGPADYPLLTRLADGSMAIVDRTRLVPHIERALAELHDRGARLTVLLCAGGFPDLRSRVPVLVPGRLLPGLVRAVTARGPIGIVTPTESQVDEAREKWRADGFDVRVTFASPFDEQEIDRAAADMREPSLRLVVLDCMGHNPDYRRVFAARTGHPVMLAQSAVARIAAEMLEV